MVSVCNCNQAVWFVCEVVLLSPWKKPLAFGIHYLCGFVVERVQAIKKRIKIFQNPSLMRLFTSLFA